MNMRLTTNLWSLLSHGIACCQLIPFHKLSFCSHPTNRWFRSIDLWPLPLSYLTCPNQQIYNKIYQDKIVCTAAITSCGNGSAWALALSLLDEMPRQLAMPDVSSCQASAETLQESRLSELHLTGTPWETLKNGYSPKIYAKQIQKLICPPQTWRFHSRVGLLKETLGDVLYGSAWWFCKGVVRVALLMVATGAACCPSISMSEAPNPVPCQQVGIIHSLAHWKSGLSTVKGS